VLSEMATRTTSLSLTVVHNRCTEVKMFFHSEVGRRRRKKIIAP